MAQVRKIDSNITGLAYAQESAPEVLGTGGDFDTAVASGNTTATDWKRILPNSYADFGGELTTITPNPISPGRQRQKGAVSDLDASGGFNVDLTFYGLRDLLSATMFANYRTKASNLETNREYIEGNVSVVTPADALPRIVSTSDDEFLGIVPGQWIFVGGDIVHGETGEDQFDDVDNNGFKRVHAVLSSNPGTRDNDILEIDKSASALTAEAATNVKIFVGRALRNEVGTSIVQKSFHLERLLGNADDLSSAAVNSGRTAAENRTILSGYRQSEYLTRATPNEFTLNVAQAALINCDFTFSAARHRQRKNGPFKTAAPYDESGTRMTVDSTGTTISPTPGDTGPLQPASAVDPVRAGIDAAHADLLSKGLADSPFNTSSDFSRIKLASVNNANPAPTPLFAFITEATITVSNNLTPNKAVGVLGAFDVTAGNFAVSGSMTAYFASVEAVSLVQNNADVTLDMIMVKNNRGIVLDIPLLALGNGRLSVEVDTPITLPLSMDAGEASSAVSGDFDYTAMFTFFEELPRAADIAL